VDNGRFRFKRTEQSQRQFFAEYQGTTGSHPSYGTKNPSTIRALLTGGCWFESSREPSHGGGIPSLSLDQRCSFALRARCIGTGPAGANTGGHSPSGWLRLFPAGGSCFRSERILHSALANTSHRREITPNRRYKGDEPMRSPTCVTPTLWPASDEGSPCGLGSRFGWRSP
jgi:hypothetical protein